MSAAELEHVLDRYPFHPSARAAVRERAWRRMLDDPEEPAERAVEVAMAALVLRCTGCGLLISPAVMTVLACDGCFKPVCPSCAVKLVLYRSDSHQPKLYAVRLCPSCVADLPQDPGAQAWLYLIRAARKGRKEGA